MADLRSDKIGESHIIVGEVQSGDSRLAPQNVYANITAAGATLLITALSNKYIKVLGYSLKATADSVDVTFRDQVGNDLTQRWVLNSREGVTVTSPPSFYVFETLNPSDDIYVYMYGTGSVNVSLNYLHSQYPL